MPAALLSIVPLNVGRFDVLGFHASDTDKFVRHVSLAAQASTASSAGPSMSLIEMAPPLTRAGNPKIPQCTGSVPLTVGQENRINVFIDEQIEEHEAAQVRSKGYIVRPHMEPKSARDGTVVYRRFSCAGFVVEAYRATELDLVTTDESDLPPISLDVIERVYPDMQGREAIRARCGLPDAGPWNVLLPGHVLHALARTTQEIGNVPYKPKNEDAVFG